MPYSCKKGDSFCLPDSNGQHRWVILTEPNDNGDIVVVNFTDSQHVDSPVIFNPKDNPRIFSKRTGVNYAFARTISADLLNNSTITNWEFCQLNHVNEIVKGAFQSQHTPICILEELKEQYDERYHGNFTWDSQLGDSTTSTTNNT